MTWRFSLSLLQFWPEGIDWSHGSQRLLLSLPSLSWNGILHWFLLWTHWSMRPMGYHQLLASISWIMNLCFHFYCWLLSSHLSIFPDDLSFLCLALGHCLYGMVGRVLHDLWWLNRIGFIRLFAILFAFSFAQESVAWVFAILDLLVVTIVFAVEGVASDFQVICIPLWIRSVRIVFWRSSSVIQRRSDIDHRVYAGCATWSRQCCSSKPLLWLSSCQAWPWTSALQKSRRLDLRSLPLDRSNFQHRTGSSEILQWIFISILQLLSDLFLIYSLQMLLALIWILLAHSQVLITSIQQLWATFPHVQHRSCFGIHVYCWMV